MISNAEVRFLEKDAFHLGCVPERRGKLFIKEKKGDRLEVRQPSNSVFTLRFEDHRIRQKSTLRDSALSSEQYFFTSALSVVLLFWSRKNYQTAPIWGERLPRTIIFSFPSFASLLLHLNPHTTSTNNQ